MIAVAERLEADLQFDTTAMLTVQGPIAESLILSKCDALNDIVQAQQGNCLQFETVAVDLS